MAGSSRGWRRWRGRWGAVGALLLASAPLMGQTDYYNTDRNRPLRIEDAYATERFAFEAKLAPVRLERGAGGSYRWGIHPEIAYGILPRTSVEVGVPIEVEERPDGRDAVAGLAGVELSVFHNLNRETRTVPALAVRGDLVLPAGRHGPGGVRSAVTAIATRTFPIGRVHLNAAYGFGTPERVEEDRGHDEGDRWLAGIAVDRVDALRARLLTASVHASSPRVGGDIEWHAAAGIRYQVNPYIALDAGAGRRFTGETTWYATFGSAIHLGIRRLIPLRRPE